MAKLSNYNPQANFTGVSFQGERPLLESELNELQDIQRGKLLKSIAKAVGDGISANSSLTINGGKVYLTNATVFVNGRVIEVTNLVCGVQAGDTVYFTVWDEEVNASSTLKTGGNEQETTTVKNQIKDSRYPFETATRTVEKFYLTTYKESNKTQLPIATVQSGSEMTVQVKKIEGLNDLTKMVYDLQNGKSDKNHTHNYLASNGNAVSSSKWATPRTIALTGAVTGSVSIDGSSNVTMTTNVNHTHAYLPLAGGTLTTSNYYGITVKRQDGNGSGIMYSNSNGALGSVGFFGNNTPDFVVLQGETTTDPLLRVTPQGNGTFKGNVTAPKFIGALTGNADTATKLKTPRSIGGTKFDGSADIEVTRLKSLGRLASCNTPIAGTNQLSHFLVTGAVTEGMPRGNETGYILNFDWDSTSGWNSQLFVGNPGSTIPSIQVRSMNQGVWGDWIKAYTTAYKPTPADIGALPSNGQAVDSAKCSGNSATATKLQTARKITLAGPVKGEVSFDGSSNVTIQTTTDMPLYTIEKTLTVGPEWIDTGIKGADLPTGTYVLEVFVDKPGHIWSERFSGVMSWYSGNTNSTGTNEIMLHGAGHSNYSGAHRIMLRTQRNQHNVRNGLLYLQISGNASFPSATYTFKFRKVI